MRYALRVEPLYLLRYMAKLKMTYRYARFRGVPRYRSNNVGTGICRYLDRVPLVPAFRMAREPF